MGIWERIKNEPALIMGLANAIIVLVVAFGIGVTDSQAQAILSLVAAVLSVITGGVVRQMVTPVRKL